MSDVQRKIYIIMSKDECADVDFEMVCSTDEMAQRKVLMRLNLWSSGYGEWEKLEHFNAKRIVTNKNKHGEFVVWFIFEWDLDTEFFVNMERM